MKPRLLGLAVRDFLVLQPPRLIPAKSPNPLSLPWQLCWGRAPLESPSMSSLFTQLQLTPRSPAPALLPRRALSMLAYRGDPAHSREPGEWRDCSCRFWKREATPSCSRDRSCGFRGASETRIAQDREEAEGVHQASLSSCPPIFCLWLHWQAQLEAGARDQSMRSKAVCPRHPRRERRSGVHSEQTESSAHTLAPSVMPSSKPTLPYLSGPLM